MPLRCAIDGGDRRRRPSQFPRQISPSSAMSVRPFDQETSTALISFRRDSKEERGREMNRGDMEGLLSHYHPNCGEGGRDGRIDSIVVIAAAVAEQSGDPLLLLYCTKKRLAIIVDPEWPFLPSFLPSMEESHAQKRGVDISAHPFLPPSL